MDVLANWMWQGGAVAVAATLILRGEEDMIATEEHQVNMKDAIVGAEFISLPGHGHNLHWEDPEKLAGLILTFLELS